MKLPSFGDKSAAAKKPTARKANEPSTLAKMNQSTKKFFSNAKDAMMPWKEKKTVSTRPTGYGAERGAKSIARSKKQEEPKGNILTSWWKDKEPEPKRPKTVPEFISGDRP
jgi:hypothetical protein